MTGKPWRRWALAPAVLVALGAFTYRDVLAGEVLAGRDVFRLFIPQGHFLWSRLSAGELPLWIPHVRLGQPFAATLQSQAFHPVRLLTLWLSGPIHAVTWQQLVNVVVGAVGAYGLARRLGRSRWAALLASGLVALAPLATSLSNLPNMAAAASLSAAMLWCVRLLMVGRRPLAFVGLALCVALSVLSGSPETTLWQGTLCVTAAWSWARGPRWPRLSRVTLSLLGGVALAGVSVLPAVELWAHSSRRFGADWAMEWSASGKDLLSLAWPMADLPRGAYWSGPNQWLLQHLFLGSVAVGLAILGSSRVRRAAPFVAGALALLLLALGRHFAVSEAVLSVPPLAYFRYPAKYLVGAGFCVAVLAAYGLDRVRVLARRTPGGWRRVLGTLVGPAVLLLAGAGLAGRASSLGLGLVTGYFWWVAFVGFAAALVVGLPHRAVVGPCVALWAVLELGLAQLLMRPATAEPQALLRPSRLAALVPRTQGGRISVDPASEASPEGSLSRYLELSRDALEPLRFIEEGLSAFEGYEPPAPRFAEVLREGATRATFELVGVETFVRRSGAPFEGLSTLAEPGELPGLYRGDNALPRAFLVQRARVASDEEALAAVRDLARPFAHTAFLAPRGAGEQGSPSPHLAPAGQVLDGPPCEGSVVRALEPSDGSTEVSYGVFACAESYLVVADAYFPGWRATLDDADVPLERADFALRAVRVPAGEHRVAFGYRPASFRWGCVASLGALVLLGLAAGWTVRRRT